MYCYKDDACDALEKLTANGEPSDYIVPVSRGGKSVMGNLQTLCEDCNCGKGNRYEE